MRTSGFLLRLPAWCCAVGSLRLRAHRIAEPASHRDAKFAGGKVFSILNVNWSQHQARMSLEELVPGGRIEDGRPVAQRSKSADRSGPGIDIESPNWIAVLQQILQHPIAVVGDDDVFSGTDAARPPM